MEKYLVDTSVLIDHLRGDSRAAYFLDTQANLATSYITIGEILQGPSDKRELKIVKSLITSFKVYWGSEQASRLAMQLLESYNLSHGLRLFDALQAAIALSASLVLVTDNVKHFKYIPRLQAVTPADFK